MQTSIGKVFGVNCRVRDKKSESVRFIAMGDLDVWKRDVTRWSYREATNAGTKFSNGDTLIARITPSLENGKTAWINSLEDGEVAQGSTEFIVLSPKDNVTDGLFGYYLCRTERFRTAMIASMTGTSGRQRVPTEAVADYEFVLPPLAEQKRIAHILGSLDDKIELNRQMNETLEAMAQALFKDWFVDFGPTRAKMEGREAYLAPEIWELFPDELGEDGVPVEWEQVALDSRLEEVSERTPISELTLETYISTENMLSNRGGVTSASSLPKAVTVPRYQRGDILISNIRPYFKKIWRASNNGGRSADVLAFRVREERDKEFIYCLVSRDLFFDFMMQTSKGVKMPRGDKDAIAAWSFSYPGHALAEAFSKVVRPFFVQAEFVARESLELTAVRDALLSRLISGEVEIGE